MTPLISYKARILEIDPSVESKFAEYEKDNKQHIIDAFERASKDPFPTIDDMHDAVYLEEGARA